MLSVCIFGFIVILADDGDDIQVQDGGYASGRSDSFVHASGKPIPGDVTSFTGFKPPDTSPTHLTEWDTDGTTRPDVLVDNFTVYEPILLENSTDLTSLANGAGNCTDLSCSSLAARQFDVSLLTSCLLCKITVLLVRRLS